MTVTLKTVPGRQYESYGVDETGQYAGKYYQCCCCCDWVSNWEHDTYSGDDEHGRHYCLRCVIEKRKPVILSAKPEVVSEIPPMYINASLEDLPPQQRKILAGWPNQRQQVVINGCAGAGKTRAAFAFVKLLAQRGVKATYIVAAEGKRAWSQAFKRVDIEKAWLNARFLIFDDISGCSGTDGWAECLQVMLDVRTREKRPTVVTTASSNEVLEGIYGKAICSRLFLFDWVELPRVDWRKK